MINDSKTFVDMPMKFDPEDVIKNFYSNVSNPYDKNQLIKFVNDNFYEVGSDLDDWIPDDYTDSPKFLNNIKDSTYRNWAENINKLWLILGKKQSISVSNNPQRSSYIKYDYPMIVPGRRFRESYYWDTYWIISGLLVCDMHKTALNLINNLINNIKHFGFIPNGGRIYYLDRSQPPLLSEMILIYVEYIINSKLSYNKIELNKFIKSSLNILEIEYNWWMNNTNNHTIEIIQNNKTYLLNRYYSNFNTPRPESYKEDYYNNIEYYSYSNQMIINNKISNNFYQNIRAGAETGWDFSSRFLRNKSLLNSIKTTEIIPIELNSILYKYEKNFMLLYQYSANLTRKSSKIYEKEILYYCNVARKRLTSIQDVLYDKDSHIWRDYNITSNKLNYNSNNIASYIPLWANFPNDLNQDICQPELKYPNKFDMNKPIEALKSSGLIQEGGILTSDILSSQQWDAPNAWPPLVLMIIEGLGYHPNAFELMVRILFNYIYKYIYIYIISIIYINRII